MCDSQWRWFLPYVQLGLSNFVQPLKEVRDLELGNMKDQIQGVSKPLTLAFVASLAYAEMVVR